MALYSDRDGTYDLAPPAVLLTVQAALVAMFPPEPERESNPLRLQVWRTIARARGEQAVRGDEQ